MKKKIWMGLISTVMAAALCFSVVACGGEGGGSDTFTGAISEESYTSSEDAVKGFLAEEISGDVVEAELVDFETSGSLTEEQIAELNTGDVLDEGDVIDSVEIVKVTYANSAATSSYAMRAASQEYSVITIYVITITPNGSTVQEYRYYVPKASNGDALTRSYYNDVLDPAKYVNCTQEYKNTTSTSVPGMTVKSDNNYTIKVTEDQATLSLHIVDPNSTSITPDYMDILGYFTYEDNTFTTWMSRDNGATYAKSQDAFAAYGVTDMASFATMCIPKIDYSYYEKTSYGFKIQDEFISKYVAMSLSASFGNSAQTSAELKFYVSDGRLTKITSSITVKVSEGGMTMTIKATEQLNFKNFGTTTVTKPANIA